MTTSELLNLSSVEISKLKKPQLRKIVQTLASTSNKRLKRLQNISADNLEPIFNIYEKLKDINPSVAEKNLKYVTLQEISEELKDGQTEDEILSRINDNLSQMYEQEMELENYDTISDFFTIE